MFTKHPKMSPEGAPAGGGAPVLPAAPSAAPAPATPAGATPAAPAAPAPTAPPENKAPAPAPTPGAEAKTPAPTATPEPKTEAAKAKEPDVATLLADFEAHKKKTADIEAQLAKSTAENRRLAFDAAFDRAGVVPQQVDPQTGKPKGPQYRDFLMSQLGDVDPRTDAGRAAIDALVAQNPAMKTAHVSTEDPVSAFLKAKTAEAKAAGQSSMWGLIPPDMMRGYDIKGGE